MVQKQKATKKSGNILCFPQRRQGIPRPPYAQALNALNVSSLHVFGAVGDR
ncbi:hypothetical protein BRYFOR_06239 [Marvinbryantia formatexigens DSM 14469]|uniref:Uncharacterized protein n=1 Tax=Marvinbryantia formatexigens DSM 14469 TaxID=478749 RepID=C6LC92_9FIRM|nr:hypothetical protein BRYFOR_06239 [Marvinbryantia formatexigens DSM 14469]